LYKEEVTNCRKPLLPHGLKGQREELMLPELRRELTSGNQTLISELPGGSRTEDPSPLNGKWNH
jgi:hypothetical protein